MFKDHETPISLFSFQDIITCLTGIMLFFLLILSIKLMEITKMLEQQSPYRSEIVEWRERNELLKRQLTELAENIRTYRQRLAGAKREDRATLSIAKFRLEKKLNELQRNALKLQAEKNSKAAEKSRAEVRKKQLERESEELKSVEDKLRQIQRQNQDYLESFHEMTSYHKSNLYHNNLMPHSPTFKSFSQKNKVFLLQRRGQMRTNSRLWWRKRRELNRVEARHQQGMRKNARQKKRKQINRTSRVCRKTTRTRRRRGTAS